MTRIVLKRLRSITIAAVLVALATVPRMGRALADDLVPRAALGASATAWQVQSTSRLTISGRILSVDSLAPLHASVLLYDANSRVLESMVTHDGTVTFRVPDAGTYSVLVRGIGYVHTRAELRVPTDSGAAFLALLAPDTLKVYSHPMEGPARWP